MALTPPPAPHTAPPATPQRGVAATFSARFDAFVVWFVAMWTWLGAYLTWQNINVTELDALQLDVASKQSITSIKAGEAAADRVATAAYAASATNAANVAGTSTSSNTIPASVTGSKSFTYVEASRTPSVGMYIMCADTVAPSTNTITIQVTAWDSGTQVVTGDVVAYQGSGTKTAWSISLTGKPGAAGVTAGTAAGTVELLTGAAIASAATINLDTATGNRVHITGTTTITAVTLTRGPRTVIFDGILTLTHHATNNNLQGAANITTAAGDRAIYESDGATVYCVAYIKKDGTAVVTSAAGLTGNAVRLTTSQTYALPAGRVKITAVGGGGGPDNTSGGGGGGGGAFIKYVDGGVNATVTIGAAGTVLAHGGDTTVVVSGVTYTAQGGRYSLNGSGLGGSGTNGDITIQGHAGGIRDDATSRCGHGGGSFLGGGVNGGNGGAMFTAGFGGGGVSNGNVGNLTGGNGCVLIEW